MDWSSMDIVFSPEAGLGAEETGDGERVAPSASISPNDDGNCNADAAGEESKENLPVSSETKAARSRMNRYRCAMRRLRLKRQALQGRLADNKPKSVKDVLDFTAGILSPQQQRFFKSQLEMTKVKANGRRFTDAQIMESLAIYYQGEKAYKHLRKTFVLPSVRCLQKRIEMIQFKPGFQDWILSVMNEKFREATGREKLVVLSFDEMQVRPNLTYLAHDDVIEGIEDFGELGKSARKADHALVFLARGLTSKWKQPVGYTLSQGPTPASVLRPLLEECIRKLRLAGFTVACVVSDMGTPNQELYSKLGVSAAAPTFTLNGVEVVCIHDAPHLIKCLRNTLMKQDIIVDAKRASWSHVAEFFERLAKDAEKAPKLTRKHVAPNNFQKMKVRYAAQVLSRSVAVGISLYSACGK